MGGGVKEGGCVRRRVEGAYVVSSLVKILWLYEWAIIFDSEYSKVFSTRKRNADNLKAAASCIFFLQWIAENNHHHQKHKIHENSLIHITHRLSEGCKRRTPAMD